MLHKINNTLGPARGQTTKSSANACAGLVPIRGEGNRHHFTVPGGHVLRVPLRAKLAVGLRPAKRAGGQGRY